MGFSKLVAPLNDGPESAIALALAAEIATYFHCHIEVVVAATPAGGSAPDASSLPPSPAPQHTLSVFDNWRRRHRLEIQPECAYRGLPSTSLVMRPGSLEVGLRDRAPFADLVCMAVQPNDAGTQKLLPALFSTGRPLLVRSAENSSEDTSIMGEPITIGWNGSAEAARAVAGAMPLIQASRRVDVISIGEGTVNAYDAYELVRYLAWCGVRAAATGILIENWTGGDVIDAACNQGAKLLVMGARENGNATAHMLQTLPMTALMAS